MGSAVPPCGGHLQTHLSVYRQSRHSFPPRSPLSPFLKTFKVWPLYLLQKIFCILYSFNKHLPKSLSLSTRCDLRNIKNSLTMGAKKTQMLWGWGVQHRNGLQQRLEQNWIWRGRTFASSLVSTEHRYLLMPTVCSVCSRPSGEQNKSKIEPSVPVHFKHILSSFMTPLCPSLAKPIHCIHHITQLETRSHVCPFPAGATM